MKNTQNTFKTPRMGPITGENLVETVSFKGIRWGRRIWSILWSQEPARGPRNSESRLGYRVSSRNRTEGPFGTIGRQVSH